MPIDYEVVPAGPIAPAVFFVRPKKKNTVTYNQLIEATALRVNQTPQNVRAVLDGFFDEAYAQILNGNSTQFREFGSLFVKMQQTLATQDGGFDPALGKASIGFKVAPGWQAKLESQALFNKVASDEVRPQVQNLFNVATGTNNQATRGNIIRISGSRLKFPPADANQGVFFVSGGGVETRVTAYESVGPTRVVCLVPAGLAVGSYTLRVKVQYTPDGAVRTGTYLNAVAVL